MTVTQFKSWFEGFSAGVGLTNQTTLTESQWNMLKEKISLLQTQVSGIGAYNE